MRFYRGNQIDGMTDVPVNQVAAMFWRSPQGQSVLDGGRLDRALRDYLTDPHGFNVTWEDESDDTGYGALFAETRRMWPAVTTAEIDTTADRTPSGYPDYSIYHV